MALFRKKAAMPAAYSDMSNRDDILQTLICVAFYSAIILGRCGAVVWLMW